MSFLAVNKRVNGVDTLFQTSPLIKVQGNAFLSWLFVILILAIKFTNVDKNFAFKLTNSYTFLLAQLNIFFTFGTGEDLHVVVMG